MNTLEEDRSSGRHREQSRESSRRVALVVMVVCGAVLLGVPLAWSLARGGSSVGERPDASVVGSPAPAGGTSGASAPEGSAVATPPAGSPSPVVPAPQPPPVQVAETVAEPVSIRAPALGIDAPVVPSGVAPDGSAEVPEDVGTIGWYRFGPAPGSSVGSAVLVGHVDSRSQGLGALASLRSAEVGDEISVVRADGSSVAYRVVAREQIAKEALPVDELFARDGEPRLTIITCGGEFQRSLSSYTDNVVVTAVPA